MDIIPSSKIKLVYPNNNTEIVTITSVKQYNQNLVNVTFSEKSGVCTYTNSQLKKMLQL